MPGLIKILNYCLWKIREPQWSGDTFNTGKNSFRLAPALLCTLLLGSCANHNTKPDTPQEDLRASALQRWNQCIKNHLNAETGSGESMSIDESMEYCQGYRYDILSTYPPHLSGSINKMLTEAAYRSGYRTLVRSRVEPEIGELLEKEMVQNPDSPVLNLLLRKAIR